jgi:hypothetical protein
MWWATGNSVPGILQSIQGAVTKNNREFPGRSSDEASSHGVNLSGVKNSLAFHHGAPGASPGAGAASIGGASRRLAPGG